MRSILSWTLQRHSEFACTCNKAAQVVELKFWEKQTAMLNKFIRKAKNTPENGLICVSLETNTAHLSVYADASFASDEDSSSLLGRLNLLCHKSNRCSILDFGSRKSKSVEGFIMSGDCMVQKSFWHDHYYCCWRNSNNLTKNIRSDVYWFKIGFRCDYAWKMSDWETACRWCYISSRIILPIQNQARWTYQRRP